MDNKIDISVSAHELLIKFLRFVVFTNTKDEHLLVHISDLQKLTQQIQNNTSEFTWEDMEWIFKPIINNIIGWNKDIENQLYLFWDAHTEVTMISNQKKEIMRPTEKIDTDIEKIAQAHKIYEDVFLESNRIKTDKLHLYSLFYCHILNSESIGSALIEQFEKMLTQFSLNDDYDIQTIFSVRTKIPRGNKFVTDVKAVRDALTHLKYEIIEDTNSWKIKFDNNEKGYNFIKLFPKEEFIQFLKNSQYLYESQHALLWVIIASIYTKKFFLQQNASKDKQKPRIK